MLRMKIDVPAGKLELQKTRKRAIMRAAGREVAALAKSLASSQGSGRVYFGPGGSAGKYRGGYAKMRYRASAPGEPPAKVTGNLVNSFVVRPFRSGDGVVVRDTAFYALFLERGARGGGLAGPRGAKVRRGRRRFLTATTRVLLPRPFLTAALDQRAPSIGPRIVRAVEQDIKFVRQRA